MSAVAAPPPAPSIGDNERLSATVVFSLILHGLLVLGVGFALDDAAPVLPTLDVILTKGTKMLTLIDKATGKRTWFTHGGRYFFKAAGTSQSFEIWTDLR